MSTPNEFYTESLNAFIGVARSFGYAADGLQTNDSLLRKGELAVRELLKNKMLIKAFGNEPMAYYYQILGLSFSMGVILGMLYRNAREKYKERDLLPMIVNDLETSPHELAFHALEQFGMAMEIYNMLVQDLYKRFVDLHEPYWQVKEPRDYTISAFWASFQTGVSVIFGKIDERNRARAEQVKAAEETASRIVAEAESERKAKRTAKKPAAKKVTGEKKATSTKRNRGLRKAKPMEGGLTA